jgi:hypothetical protein
MSSKKRSSKSIQNCLSPPKNANFFRNAFLTPRKATLHNASDRNGDGQTVQDLDLRRAAVVAVILYVADPFAKASKERMRIDDVLLG